MYGHVVYEVGRGQRERKGRKVRKGKGKREKGEKECKRRDPNLDRRGEEEIRLQRARSKEEDGKRGRRRRRRKKAGRKQEERSKGSER